MTEWRTIVRFPDYAISDKGEVRRLTQVRGTAAGQAIKWHTQTSNGYPNVRLRRDGRTWAMSVHCLMAETFIGARPEGQQVRHLDGDKMNCRLSNIAYGTPKDNGQDKVRHGRSIAAEKNPRAKLTVRDANEVRVAYASGESAKRIAERYGLNPSTVHRLVAGTYWAQEASNRAQDRSMR